METQTKELILRKESGLIECDAHLTLVQEKLYNGLLFHAKKTMFRKGNEFWDENPGSNFSGDFSYDYVKNDFTISLAELAKLSCQTKIDLQTAKSLLLELMDIKAEYNILGKDKYNNWVSFVLIPQVEIANGEVHYSLPPWYFEKLIFWKTTGSLVPFAKVDMVRQATFKSRYALRFYQVFIDYKDSHFGIPELSIADVKRILGVKAGYKRFENLIRCISAATEEINNNSDIDFKINYKITRCGQKPKLLKFFLKPERRSLSEDMSRTRVNGVQVSDSNKKIKEQEQNQKLTENNMTDSQGERVHLPENHILNQIQEQNQKLTENNMTDSNMNGVHFSAPEPENRIPEISPERVKEILKDFDISRLPVEKQKELIARYGIGEK